MEYAQYIKSSGSEEESRRKEDGDGNSDQESAHYGEGFGEETYCEKCGSFSHLTEQCTTRKVKKVTETDMEARRLAARATRRSRNQLKSQYETAKTQLQQAQQTIYNLQNTTASLRLSIDSAKRERDAARAEAAQERRRAKWLEDTAQEQRRTHEAEMNAVRQERDAANINTQTLLNSVMQSQMLLAQTSQALTAARAQANGDNGVQTTQQQTNAGQHGFGTPERQVNADDYGLGLGTPRTARAASPPSPPYRPMEDDFYRERSHSPATQTTSVNLGPFGLGRTSTPSPQFNPFNPETPRFDMTTHSAAPGAGSASAGYSPTVRRYHNNDYPSPHNGYAGMRYGG